MPVDTSSYPKGGAVAPANPLTAFGQVVGINNALNTNQLFQQSFQDRALAAQAYKTVTNPLTGEVDYDKLPGVLAGLGGGQLIPEQMKAIQEQQKRAVEIDQGKLKLHLDQRMAANNALSTLISDPSDKNVSGQLAMLIKQGVVPVDKALDIWKNLPPDPGERVAQLNRMLLEGLQGEARLQAQFGSVAPVNTGGRTAFVQSGPMTPPREVGSLQNTMTPGEAGTPTPMLIRNPDGTQSMSNGTREQFVQTAQQGPVATAPALTPTGLTPEQASQPIKIFDQATKQERTTTLGDYVAGLRGGVGPGMPTPQPGAGPGPAPLPPGAVNPTAPPGAPGSTLTADPNAPGAILRPVAPAVAPGPLGTGRYGAPGAPPPATPGGMPSVASAPPLGAAAAEEVAGRTNAERAVLLSSTAESVPQRKALLGEMEAAITKFEPGPGADSWKTAKAAWNRLNPIEGMMFDPQAIASQETFNKQATQLAQEQFKVLGGTGTDAKLGSAMESNPNSSLSKLGSQQIMQLLKGNEDAIAVKNREWQAYLDQPGRGPQDYARFTTEFNRTFDPRVFQSAYMSPEQRVALVKEMSPAEEKSFRASYTAALQKGWIQPIQPPVSVPVQ